MKVLKNSLVTLLLGILAGIAISIGGIAFLASPSKAVGAIFFCVGLFMVCALNLNLFTGKVTTALDEKPIFILKLIIIYIGNLLGAVLVGYLLRATRLGTSLVSSVEAVATTKINDSFLSIFILGIFCNVLIYLAVYGFKNFENSVFRMMALMFGVSVFVLVGFEHCVANMFYFSFANMWSTEAIMCLLATTLGNIIGGLFFPIIFKINKTLNKDKNDVQKNLENK